MCEQFHCEKPQPTAERWGNFILVFRTSPKSLPTERGHLLQLLLSLTLLVSGVDLELELNGKLRYGQNLRS